MDKYVTANRKTATFNVADFLTEKQLQILSSNHPRGSINIRYDDGTVKSYNLETLAALVVSQLPDPYTLAPFRRCDIRRICLYIQSIKEFPDYQLNTTDLYHRFIHSYDPTTQLTESEIEKIKLEAKCFIQAEDLLEIFRKYLGNGNLDNREMAEKELSDQPIGSWLIRNCSILESEQDRPMVITFKSSEDTYQHIPFVHKIGVGFFLIDSGVCRGTHISTAELIEDSDQPSIVDLLENIPGLLIKNAYRGTDQSEKTNLLNDQDRENNAAADHINPEIDTNQTNEVIKNVIFDLFN